MATKIVVDTNIFVSALLSSSSFSRAIIRRCLQLQYVPLMGNALFAEYESVLNQETVLAKCPLPSAEIQKLLAAFMAAYEWVSIYYLWRPNLQDEGDNHLIELAIAGNAAAIITNNVKDFQRANLLFPNLEILKPEILIQR